jgi:hypothetical protein
MSEDKVENVAPIVKKRPPVTPSRFGLSEEVRRVFSVTVEQGTDPESLLEPGYWSLVAKNFSPFDRVEVMHIGTDKTWFVELMVISCSQNHAKMEIMRKQEFDKRDTSNDMTVNGYSINYGNKHTGYRVVRDTDKQVMSENHQSRDMALKWIQDNRFSLVA